MPDQGAAGVPPLRELTDPRTMRALAHPVRLSLLEALTDAGRLTATQAGEAIGESAAACSFHLRQLAKYGFIEEASGGRGRERPWKLAHAGVRFSDVQQDREAAIAARGLERVFRERHLRRMEASLAARQDYPAEWREATGSSQFLLYVTPEELRAIDAELVDLLTRHQDRLADPARRPEGSLPIELLVFSYPLER